MLKQYLELGEFVTTHGLTGEIKLYPWCDSPDFASKFKKIYFSSNANDFKNVESARVHKNTCLFKLEGINSIEQAHSLLGKTVWIDRADVKLPDGSFFIQDIFGAEMIDASSGKVYGEIVNITQPGRHDVYEVRTKNGDNVFFPAVAEFVKRKEILAGKVFVSPIKGMFEDSSLKDDKEP